MFKKPVKLRVFQDSATPSNLISVISKERAWFIHFTNMYLAPLNARYRLEIKYEIQTGNKTIKTASLPPYLNRIHKSTNNNFFKS